MTTSGFLAQTFYLHWYLYIKYLYNYDKFNIHFRVWEGLSYYNGKIYTRLVYFEVDYFTEINPELHSSVVELLTTIIQANSLYLTEPGQLLLLSLRVKTSLLE